MSGYLWRRIGQAILVVALAYSAVFFVLNVLPGDPIEQQIANPENPISDEDAQALRAYYRLDQPAYVQFALSVERLASGDLGFSLNSGQPVARLLGAAFPSTLALASIAFVLAALIGFGIALAAVFAPWAPVRETARTLPPMLLSIPAFVSGLLVLQLVSFQLGWMSAVRDEGLRSAVYAAIPLALPVAAPIAQILTQGLSNAYGQPYVEVLRAKGLAPRRIVFGHVVRNGAIPTVTIVAITVGELLAGSVITETVFNRTGIGYLTEVAVRNKDTPIIQAVVISVSVTFVVINLLTDLVYPLIDPRIRRSAPARTEAVPT
ncbi:ABC transporter permease [Nocardia sp. BMG51109]|uniref:ABC transporter permease n=1 Tax=Nocardia sp. BMG51109 TaxID=1056816 RepID=UPI000467BE67|nr:ABC transporter permease [Nocardia sp. BMG51109]